MMTDCNECNARARGYSGLFNITCEWCRTDLAMQEPCKLMREMLVESMLKFGPTNDYRREPTCDCGRTCQRKAAIFKD